ncbi:hypothetical protein [Parabacteroides sp. Marseille-P3160]|uniref:hypothetical protein n=1 Tax=Parabacteroides sp. Marseille-P3160 TaxID=1917887 RepID=UPI0009BABEAD|nr:hypothetical protein [Parabacteroides sp. Marseille-P3160]
MKKFLLLLLMTSYAVMSYSQSGLIRKETENNTGRNVSSVTVEPYTIQLWNERQGLVRTVESTESVQQLSVQGLSKGMYYVHVVRKGHPTLKQKLIVQ